MKVNRINLQVAVLSKDKSEKVKSLVSMGFSDEERVIDALSKNQWNIETVVALLTD